MYKNCLVKILPEIRMYNKLSIVFKFLISSSQFLILNCVASIFQDDEDPSIIFKDFKAA